MKAVIEFWLNDRPIRTDRASGTPLVDFVRQDQGLLGTKEGCREGDCGACAVLVGEKETLPSAQALLAYRAMPSCMLALGALQSCHLITIEGLVSGAPDGLSPVMRAFLEENASQCGFCSPGFVLALTAWLANPQVPHDMAGAMTAIDGNLCRCTGYGAIRRAAARLIDEFGSLPREGKERLAALVQAHVLPPSVLMFDEATKPPAASPLDCLRPPVIVGGGTDFYVRTPYPEQEFSPLLLHAKPAYRGLVLHEDKEGACLELGASLRVSDFFASDTLRRVLPDLPQYETAFASTLIRNLATLGGNIVNASPVGDISAILLALDASLEIVPVAQEEACPRILPLHAFFLGYKKVDLAPGEAVRRIFVPLPQAASHKARHSVRISFEKAAKRKTLDIAAVNSALACTLADGVLRHVHVSAGGVAATPLVLHRASALMEGKTVDTASAAGKKALADLARAVAAQAEAEISPISDVRGSKEYRRRITGRLVLAHFLRLFPEAGLDEELFP